MSDYLGRVELMILSTLVSGEKYGLEIMKAIESSEKKRKLSFGSLYPTLHRLEKKGFIKGKWGIETPDERAGARRKYYKLTALGAKSLKQTREGFLDLWGIRLQTIS